MPDTRLERLAPLAGAVFSVVFAIGFLSSGDTPDTKASGEEVISHYSDSGKFLVGIFALVIGAVFFMFFAGALRGALLRSTRTPEWLATVVFGGAVVYATALSIFAMGQIMLIDASDLGRPEVAQTLNVFDNDNFFPAVLGLATVLLASGWSILQSAVLPRWLGWASVGLGVLAMAGPAGFIAFLLFPIWVLTVSIILYKNRAVTPTTAAGVGGSTRI